MMTARPTQKNLRRVVVETNMIGGEEKEGNGRRSPSVAAPDISPDNNVFHWLPHWHYYVPIIREWHQYLRAKPGISPTGYSFPSTSAAWLKHRLTKVSDKSASKIVAGFFGPNLNVTE